MKKFLPLLLAVAVLSVGCKDDPKWDGTYDIDGEWEVWAASGENNCAMLGVGAPHYSALLESDAAEDNYSFTGSEAGDYCWDREYVRVGNELSLTGDYLAEVGVPEPTDCVVRIERERLAVFSSDDLFSETSTVHVSWDAGDGCPAGSETGDWCPEDKECCEARFLSVGVRCDDCWQECAAGALVADPELETAAAPGP